MKKYSIVAALLIVIAIGVISSTPADPSSKNGYTNLKVLPRDISTKQLQSIMIDDFEDGLGVGCNFCHAEAKGSHKLDYASDAKPEKEIARAMMRMTVKVNSKYFKARHAMIGDKSLIVTCTTCHNGKPRPESEGGE
ncbi:MAG: c-type cytochrome [Bacteroidetes bacterium]|nr:c-type cytochrome [Bacteroidota bacterium]